MNRRKAVLYLLLGVPRRFDLIQMIPTRFNRLSGFLRPVRSDCQWFGAS